MKKIFLLLLFLTSTLVYGQRITITGTVTDESGAPLAGATVQVKGTTFGTLTDVSGRYSLEVPGAGAVLIYSFVGYISREIPVGNQTTITTTLREDIQGLEDSRMFIPQPTQHPLILRWSRDIQGSM